MAFDGKEGGLITQAEGAAMTARFRVNFPNQVKARYFGKDLLNTILAQTGCKGIRFYFAQNASNEMELVICGADSSENDMLNKIGDMALPCPSRCSSANSLNS